MALTSSMPAVPSDPFVEGRIPADFALEPFTGVWEMLRRSWRAYRKDFPTIALMTIVVFGPAEALKNFLLYSANQQENFQLAFRLDSLIEAIFGSLVAPAVIFAVMSRMRTGQEPGIGKSLRWGLRQWLRTLGYRLITGIAIGIGIVLLILPGIAVAILLSLVTPIIAVEADHQSDVLRRSWTLARDHAWKILGAGLLGFILFALAAITAGVAYGVVSLFGDSWFLSTAFDCLISIGFNFFNVLLLLIYLGILAGAKEEPPPGSLGLSPMP